MASIQERRNKDGVLTAFKILVHRGRDAGGKQLKPYITTFKVEQGWSEKTARKKAEAFAAIYEKACKEGLASDARQTFQQYCDYVIRMKEERGVKATTVARYRDLAKRIYPEIGYLKIRDIRPDTLNVLYSWLNSDGMNMKTGGKLSPKTILEHHRLIHTVFENAVMEGLISSNPADRVIPPKNEAPEVEYYQPEDIEAIQNALEEEPIKWKAFTYVLLITGARRGEVVGLRWSDIDFENNTISFERNVQYLPTKGIYVDTPKTSKGYRTISVPAEMIRVLRSYKAWQAGEKMRLGVFYEDQGFIFTKEDGSPMHPDTPNRWLKRFADRHGLSHIHPHAFRHSMASLLFFKKADNVSVSRRLGHAQVSTTENIYAHVIKKADKENAEILEDAFFKEG